MNQNERDQQIRQAILDRVLTRTLTDPEFRNMLIDNPKSAIARELGIDIPDHIHITVLPETSNQIFIAIPALDAGDTSNQAGFDRLVQGSSASYGGRPSAYGGRPLAYGGRPLATGVERLANEAPSPAYNVHNPNMTGLERIASQSITAYQPK